MSATQETITENMKAKESTMEPKQDLFMSSSIAKLTEALSKAQGQFEHAKKSVSNEFFKSKYADLAGVIDAAREPLSKNGLAVIQLTKVSEGEIRLVTILSHSSGEWLRGEYPLKPVKQDPQGYGSAFTYARRYCFSAITGIAQDDDDGNTASQGKPETAAARNKRFKGVLAEINACEDMTSLQYVWQHEQPSILGFKAEDETFYDELVKAKDARKKAIADKEVSELAAPTLEY